MTKTAKALVRKEYPTFSVVLQGVALEPVEVYLREMPGIRMLEVTSEFFTVVGAMLAKDDGKAVAGKGELTKNDTNGLIALVTLDAFKRIIAESARIDVSLVEEADNDCLEEAVLAAVKANRPFFLTWCTRFGLDLDELMEKGLSGLMTPSPTN
jgi:hypothetical protein